MKTDVLAVANQQAVAAEIADPEADVVAQDCAYDGGRDDELDRELVTGAGVHGGGDQHGHAHAHGPGDGAKHAAHAQDEPRRIDTGRGIFLLEVFEDGVLPRFRLRQEDHPEIASMLGDKAATIETERPGGVRQTFHFADRGAFLE
jgi:hypothetical protein